MPIHIDILSPFYPLQEYPKQQKKVDKIKIELENALIEILDNTKPFFLFFFYKK
jgi:hypothetical protein